MEKETNQAFKNLYEYLSAQMPEALADLGLIKKALRQSRKDTIEEMIKLSDIIESQYTTEFNEWRAFKGFRNTMRDKLK